MKLTQYPSKIVGVRVGEVELSLVVSPSLLVKYVMLRNPEDSNLDGVNAGKYTKSGPWSEKVREALEVFINALEEEALPELFDVPGDKRGAEVGPPILDSGPSLNKKDEFALSFPTLGGIRKTTPQL